MQIQNQTSSSVRWYATNGLILAIAVSNFHTLTSSDFLLTPISTNIERFPSGGGSQLTQDTSERFAMLKPKESALMQIDNPLDLSENLVMDADVPDAATVLHLETEARQFLNNYNREFVDAALPSDEDWMR